MHDDRDPLLQSLIKVARCSLTCGIDRALGIPLFRLIRSNAARLFRSLIVDDGYRFLIVFFHVLLHCDLAALPLACKGCYRIAKMLVLSNGAELVRSRFRTRTGLAECNKKPPCLGAWSGGMGDAPTSLETGLSCYSASR